jgi:hypothetical protein
MMTCRVQSRPTKISSLCKHWKVFILYLFYIWCGDSFSVVIIVSVL